MKKLFDSLNGWQRVGIVLSVLWFFVASFSARIHDVDKAYEFANNSSNICYEIQRNTGNSDDCGKRFSDDYKLMIEGSWGSSLAVGIIPIPIFWGIVILIIKLFRWIKKGFTK
jgi:hypothetical protein